MIHKAIVGNAPYKVIEVMDLPETIKDELADQCVSNDSGVILNPEYHPKLKAWLKNNGHDENKCYIGWWCW